MQVGPKIAQVAALVGDPSRANMLSCLMAGRAQTATELAYVAGISPQTASGHLSKLTDAGLVALSTQGRHRYYRLASPQVARMLEGLAVVAQAGPARATPHWRGGDALRTARSCYDHLAGRIAVRIADRLVDHAYVELTQDGGAVTPDGQRFLAEAGIVLQAGSTRRVFCRPCLDWSERRPHLAGTVGAVLLQHALTHAWVQRVPDSRALTVTDAGRRGFGVLFGASVDA